MKFRITLILFLIISSCASKKEVIQGYEKSELEKRRRWILGNTPQEIIKLLGTPAAHGECRRCAGKKAVYRIIYLRKDMSKFYYDLSLNTDMEVECIIMDIIRNDKGKYLFRKNTPVYAELNCNQSDGAIIRFKKILEEQEVKR